MIISNGLIPASAFTKRILLTLLLLGSFQILQAQQRSIDSILMVLHKHPQEDTARANIIAELAYKYNTVYPDSTILLAEQAYLLSQKLEFEMGAANALKYWGVGLYMLSRYDEALAKNKQALILYEKLDYPKGCAAIFNNIANVICNQGDLDGSIAYYNKSLDIRQKINDQAGIADCYNNIGNTYSDKGNLTEALFYLFKGLRIREKIHNEQGIANSLSNIANIYYYLGKYDALILYSKRSLVAHEKLGNKDGIMQSLIALGAVYNIQKKYKEALACFTRAMIVSEEMNSPHSIALSLGNMGAVLITLQRFEESKKCYERSLRIDEEIGDQEGIAINHNGIGQVLIHSNEYRKAVEHLLLSTKISASIGAQLLLLESSQNLALAYEKLKDYHNMALTLQQVVVLKDSLFSEEVTKKTQQLEFNFILDKKQKEIVLLEKDSSIQKGIAERRRLVNISLASVLTLSLALVLALWLSAKRIKKAQTTALKQKEKISKQAEELQENNTLKDKIFSVLSHDLRSPIASLTGIMTLMDHDMITPEEFSKVKEGMNNQLSALGLLLDNLLYWSRSQLNGHIIRRETINIVPLIQQNIKLLDDSAKQKNITLVFNNTASNGVNVYADMNHTDIVIRNLISNALKFTNPNGKIEVDTKVDKKTVTISVKDNGIGIDNTIIQQLFTNKLQSNQGTSGEKGTGLGLLLCKDFAEQNDGTLRVTSKPGEGSTFYFTLPKG